MNTARPWVIWSEEHGAWWRAGASGYTRSLFDAGRYSETEASIIAAQANSHLRRHERINEIAVPDPVRRLELEARIEELEDFIKTLSLNDNERNKARELFGLPPLPLDSAR